MFRSIPNYNNYLINESGVIMNQITNTLVRTSTDNNGYMYVHLDGHIEYIHDLVAKTFYVFNPDAIYPIHADGDPMNNHISNIRYSVRPENISYIENRQYRYYSNPKYYYEIYNDTTGDIVRCLGRGEVALKIQYEEISLKNMIGNGRVIALGPYAGYKIRRVKTNKEK